MATPDPKRHKGLNPPVHSTLQHRAHHSHPLAIPEVIRVLSQYLNRSERAKCLRINKRFYQTLLPIQWSNLEIHIYPCKPTVATIKKHSHLVRELHCAIECDAFEEQTGSWMLPNLEHLQFYNGYSEATPYTSKKMATFLRLHQESLKSFVGYEVNSGVVLDALAKCKKIEKVQIQHLHLSSPNIFFDRYPTLWSQLKTLSLGGCWFNTGKDIDKILLGVRKKVEKQAKIQHLTIRTPEGDHAVYELQALLIKNCPELVSLSWAPGSLVRKNKTGAIIHLAKAIEFGYKFPKLESIHVEGDKNFRNQELAVVLRGLPSLTNVALPETSFDVACWDFMKRGIPRYMTSLKELDLGGCAFTTGAMVHNVLCSAPTLEVFRGNYIKTSNFQNDRRPWVCTGLKKLTLEFILDLGDDETQICKAGRMTFERISQLVQLEELSLDSHYGRVDSYSNYGRNDSFWAKHRDGEWDGVLQLKEAQPVLQFLLAQGLEQLGTLRSLRILGGLRLSDSMLDYQGTELEEAETNWMVEHLPELKETREFPTSFKAGEILRKRGIKKKDSGIIPPHKFRKNCSIS